MGQICFGISLREEVTLYTIHQELKFKLYRINWDKVNIYTFQINYVCDSVAENLSKKLSYSLSSIACCIGDYILQMYCTMYSIMYGIKNSITYTV